MSRFPALRHRDFALLVGSNMLSRIGTQMREVALAWQIYLLTHSPMALGLIGACRVVPIAVFALGGGVIADAYDRRKVLLTTQTILTLTSSTMAYLTWKGLVTVPILYVLIAVSAATAAFDGPARQTLVTNLLPEEDLPNGLALSINSIQIAFAAGPAIGGQLLARTSIQTVYLIDALSFIPVLAALLVIRPRADTKKGPRADVSFRAIGGVLEFLKKNPPLIGLMLIDFIATFFGGSLQLLPFFANDVFKVGVTGLGLLSSASAVGSVAASFWMSFTKPVRRYGLIVLGSVVAYGAFIAAFGLTSSFVLGLVLLAASGAADSVSTVVRQVVRQTLTPDEMRGRMTGMNMIFFIGGPQLGEVEAGGVAELTTPKISVTSGGLLCVVAAIVMGLSFKSVRELEKKPA